MKDLRKNEFKDLLEMNELLFQEQDHFIRTDISGLGEIIYYPKKNRIQISKGNKWVDDGYLFIKNHLSEKPSKEVIRKLILKHFDNLDISYGVSGADFVDDGFTRVEEAIIAICEEYKNLKL